MAQSTTAVAAPDRLEWAFSRLRWGTCSLVVVYSALQVLIGSLSSPNRWWYGDWIQNGLSVAEMISQLIAICLLVRLRPTAWLGAIIAGGAGVVALGGISQQIGSYGQLLLDALLLPCVAGIWALQPAINARDRLAAASVDGMALGPNHAQALRLLLAESDIGCAHCGYNLRGLSQDTCPECGRFVPLLIGSQTLPLRARQFVRTMQVFMLLTMPVNASSAYQWYQQLPARLTPLSAFDIGWSSTWQARVLLNMGLHAFALAIGATMLLLRPWRAGRPGTSMSELGGATLTFSILLVYVIVMLLARTG